MRGQILQEIFLKAQITAELGIIGVDFGSSFFNTGAGDLINSVVACFARFGFGIGRFVDLYTDITAVASLSVFDIFSVKLHHGVGGGAGTGEEIEDNEISIKIHFCKIFNQINWFWITIVKKNA